MIKSFVKYAAILLLTLLPVKAAVFATNNLAVSTNHYCVAGAFVLQQLQLFTTNDTPGVVKVFDGLPYVDNTQYTNYITYTTNIVSSVITSTGTTNSITNKTVFILPQTVAAARSFATPRFAYSVDKLNPVTIVPTGGFEVFSSRLTLDVGATGAGAVAVYRSP